MLFGKKNVLVSINSSIISERTRKELAYNVRVAVGHRSIEQFGKILKMIDPKPLVNLIKMNYSELPNRNLLRKIASASENRVTFQNLYAICGYSERDPEEDRSWAKWVPRWAEVYMCDLGVGEDCIQGGKRNVLIIQNNKGNQHSPNVSVLPISSKSKFNSSLHILLEKELGFERDSYCLSEMPLTISKRRFFYNSVPYKITTLPNHKMKEVQYGLEKQFGFLPLYFDEEHAFSLIQHIRSLEQNLKHKKAHNLKDILQEKFNELISYCDKYKKDYKYVIQEFNRINNYAYKVV